MGSAVSREKPRAFEAIVAHFRSDILHGRRKPGDRLPPQQAISEQFNVSRTGVREAIRVLENQGLVQVRHGYAGGVFVADDALRPVLGALHNSLQLGHVDVDELYVARLIFEPMVARMAAERATDLLVAQLEENCERARAAVEARKDAFAINLHFHAIIARASGNRVLGIIVQTLVDLLETLDREYPTNRTVSKKAVSDHSKLIAAIRDHKGGRAESLMSEHLRELKGRFEQIQRQMRRARASDQTTIPPWGGLRFDPSPTEEDLTASSL
jgi:DNA-binding FadR family transcriptional regulator